MLIKELIEHLSNMEPDLHVHVSCVGPDGSELQCILTSTDIDARRKAGITLLGGPPPTLRLQYTEPPERWPQEMKDEWTKDKKFMSGDRW